MHIFVYSSLDYNMKWSMSHHYVHKSNMCHIAKSQMWIVLTTQRNPYFDLNFCHSIWMKEEQIKAITVKILKKTWNIKRILSFGFLFFFCYKKSRKIKINEISIISGVTTFHSLKAVICNIKYPLYEEKFPNDFILKINWVWFYFFYSPPTLMGSIQ